MGLTDLERLCENKIVDVRTKYHIDASADINDPEVTGDVAVVYEAGPFAVTVLPTISGEWFDLDVRAFIDGKCTDRWNITLRKEP